MKILFISNMKQVKTLEKSACCRCPFFKALLWFSVIPANLPNRYFCNIQMTIICYIFSTIHFLNGCGKFLALFRQKTSLLSLLTKRELLNKITPNNLIIIQIYSKE